MAGLLVEMMKVGARRSLVYDRTPGATPGRLHPKRACRVPGCYNLQPCPLHKRKTVHAPDHVPYEGRKYKAAGGRAWQRKRKEILTRDGYRCVYCGEKAEVVDHVRNRARGGGDEDGNLVACCKPCNEKKQQREARRGRRSNILSK